MFVQQAVKHFDMLDAEGLLYMYSSSVGCVACFIVVYKSTSIRNSGVWTTMCKHTDHCPLFAYCC